jgi:AcrR family transcriptional regulator
MANEPPPSGRRRRGRPPAAPGPSTRERVLDAAQRLFGQVGYAAMTVEQVARDVGVDARTVYHYFPSKRELFRAAADAAFEASLAQGATLVLAHEDFRGQLHGFIELYRVLHRERPWVVPFFASVIVEGMVAGGLASAERPAFDATELPALGGPVRAGMRAMADAAVARGDLDPSVGADTAAVLLQMVATGLGLISRSPEASFPALLDALDLLIDGSLLRR